MIHRSSVSIAIDILRSVSSSEKQALFGLLSEFDMSIRVEETKKLQRRLDDFARGVADQEISRLTTIRT